MQPFAAAMKRPADGPEDRALQERCITYGSPQLTAGYQSYYQIVQTPNVGGHHDGDDSRCPRDSARRRVRIFPPRSSSGWGIRAAIGKATRWSSIRPTTSRRASCRMSSEKLHVTERFSRTGPETLKYEITIDDPGTWTKPWSLMIPLRHSPMPVYEYACHEGNIGMAGILAGARAEERAAGL